MTREQVLLILRQHQVGLAVRGIKSLAIFGSVARNEASSASDIDILVDFIGSATFDGYMETKFYLESLLGCQVDLVVQQALKPRMRPVVEREAIYVTGLSALS